MQFNFKFFQTALLAGTCLTSIYSADSGGVIVVDELLNVQQRVPVKPGEAVNNKALRDRFFAEYSQDDKEKEKLLKALVGIAIIDRGVRASHEEFLTEAIARSFLLQIYLRTSFHL